jgi:hypothetical protein
MDSTALAKEPFVSITTFRHDGTPVSVPVWCAADDGLLVETAKVEALLARKYGWAWRGYRALMVFAALLRRLRRQLPAAWLTIRITLREAGPDQPNLGGSADVRPARSGLQSRGVAPSGSSGCR